MTEEDTPLLKVYVQQPHTRVRVSIHLTDAVTDPFTYGIILADVINALADTIHEAELTETSVTGEERRLPREEIFNSIRSGFESELSGPTAEKVVPS